MKKLLILSLLSLLVNTSSRLYASDNQDDDEEILLENTQHDQASRVPYDSTQLFKMLMEKSLEEVDVYLSQGNPLEIINAPITRKSSFFHNNHDSFWKRTSLTTGSIWQNGHLPA